MCASLRLAFSVLPAIVAAARKSATENPAFMMMSGISSREDLCFVVENGLYSIFLLDVVACCRVAVMASFFSFVEVSRWILDS